MSSKRKRAMMSKPEKEYHMLGQMKTRLMNDLRWKGRLPERNKEAEDKVWLNYCVASERRLNNNYYIYTIKGNPVKPMGSDYDGWLDKHFISGAKRLSVLEFGCDSGDDTSFLSKTRHKVISCDYNNGRVNAVRRVFPSVEAILLDKEEPFPFKTAAMDVVISNLYLGTLNQINWPDIIAEIKRVLKKSGTFLCRLKSSNGYLRGKADERMYVPGLHYQTNKLRDGDKVFDPKSIPDAFSGWNIVSVDEYEVTMRYKRKTLLEIVMTPTSDEGG